MLTTNTHTHTNRHCGTENVTNFAAQVVTRTYTTPKANTIRDHPRNFQITRPSTIVCVSNQIKSNCTFIRRLLKSDFSQAPPTSSMRAQTRQFLTIAWTVPVRCPRSSDCQADCSTLWGRRHGSFWVQNGQFVSVFVMPWDRDLWWCDLVI